MYSGNYSSWRHSRLNQITTENVHRLHPKWLYQMRVTHKVETTPLVVDGIMYLTRPPSDVVALDAETGRTLWTFQYRVRGPVRPCCGQVNRGLAILGNRVFINTIDAQMIALDAKTGRQLWANDMADFRQGYVATSAPLAVKDKVITGVGGGENGMRGFVEAYDAATGKRLWRFNTVPGPGEPNFGTWEGDSWKTGAAGIWITGSYDPDLNLVYWGTGNPGPDYVGEKRKGDNLYSCSMLALDPDTGKLKWYFQYTPHDLHDWDATQVAILLDAPFGGRARKLLLQANRNGFYYALDRQTGAYLMAKAYVAKQTWAKQIDDRGRPVLLPNTEPTVEGTEGVWPGIEGGANWMSPTYSPQTGLIYVPVREESRKFYKSEAVYRPGEGFTGGFGGRFLPEEAHGRIVALAPLTGELMWEYRLLTPPWSGLLSTAGNLVFGSTMEGHVFALDARTGKHLWHFPGNHQGYSNPISYLSNGKQYVAVPIGDVLIAFGLD
jgi:alcohol dehydrogenase (cytochrome c)